LLKTLEGPPGLSDLRESYQQKRARDA